jgi:hypothetical protein
LQEGRLIEDALRIIGKGDQGEREGLEEELDTVVEDQEIHKVLHRVHPVNPEPEDERQADIEGDTLLSQLDSSRIYDFREHVWLIWYLHLIPEIPVVKHVAADYQDKTNSDYHEGLVCTKESVAYEDRALKVEELVYQTQKGDRDTEHSENVLELVEEWDFVP